MKQALDHAKHQQIVNELFAEKYRHRLANMVITDDDKANAIEKHSLLHLIKRHEELADVYGLYCKLIEEND
jgi:DNA-binding TFAR19-related protein (PDSD5 family)